MEIEKLKLDLSQLSKRLSFKIDDELNDITPPKLIMQKSDSFSRGSDIDSEVSNKNFYDKK